MDRTSLIAQLRQRALAGKNSGGPLYRRLAQALKGLIDEGLLAPGTALPGERDLAEALEVGRVTVRSAYRDLMTEGSIETRHGSGTFVSGRLERMEQSLWRLSSFSADMRSRGRVPASRILSRSLTPPAPEEAFLLGLSQDETVLRLDRLRIADDLPLAIERSVVPLRFLGKEPDGQGSLYEALAQAGHKPVRAMQKLMAVVFDPAAASALGLAKGAPALLIERISRDGEGRIVEFTRSHYRGDAYDFVVELRLGDEDEP